MPALQFIQPGHKVLRGMMYDTALILQQTYFADADEGLLKIEMIN